MIVGNLNGHAARVLVAGIAGATRLCAIDADNVEALMGAPDAIEFKNWDATKVVELAPHALAIIDWEENHG